ncbi:MAG: hypothetical protein IKL52_00435 [Candidatus Gastranaerophilales bacterium]|nr:hypothetical protein [Candidatus Gastranaerophilales bacterium]
MERKLKIMGIYTGMLFFVSVLLILVTSFSNSKMDPSYDVEAEKQKQINFDATLEQSVNVLTENNRVLNETVEDLKKQLNEKDNIIYEYSSVYNEDMKNLYKTMSLYTLGEKEEAKKVFQTVDKENILEYEKPVYDVLSKNLN